MQHSGVLEAMRLRRLRGLADGGFELPADAGIVGDNDEQILIPWDGPGRWVDRTLTQEKFAYNRSERVGTVELDALTPQEVPS